MDQDPKDANAEKFSPLRGELLKRIREIDDTVLVEVATGTGRKAGQFSDWHDRWNDGGRWVDTFGKAGDRPTDRGFFALIRNGIARILNIRPSSLRGR